MKEDESFRDKISTIDNSGKRAWLNPLKPKGRFYDLRKYASYFYLLLFFGLPFIKVGGNPLFLINILERKFILFGTVFWPQDMFIFGLGMVIFIVFIALFTVIFGRVFCGWACPHTIFLELIFRRVEYWIDGDSAYQKQLAAAPWDANKIIKRTSKYFIFFLISFIIANGFLSYIIGVDELFKIMSEPISQHKGGFISILIFTGVFFFIYSWFREQVCLIACPYGRMQGVLLDKDSIVVAYDYVRGEERKKFKKNEERTAGDCVDCNLCVKVCPTGIDIRNGTQLECTNCTACIDVCDNMMDAVGLKKGLIRYASENDIKNKIKSGFTTRMKAYVVVLLVLIGIESTLLITREDYDATVIRAKGLLYQEQPNDMISNLYTIKLLNKTKDSLPVILKLEDYPDAKIEIVGKQLYTKSENMTQGGFFIYLSKKDIKSTKTKLKISLYSNNKKISTVKTTFLGPITTTQ